MKYNLENLKTAIEERKLPKGCWPIPERAMNNESIRNYIDCEKRFTICFAGRQAYKTIIAKRKLVAAALTRPETRYLIGASTWTQTKNIYWEGAYPIFDLIPPYMIKKRSDSLLHVTLYNDSIISLFSADSPSRAEGTFYHGCILDEASEYNITDVFGTHILPMLSPVAGWCIILGIPRTSYSNDFKNLYIKYKRDEDWGIFNWSSKGITPDIELDLAKRLLDERTFDIEYMGLWLDEQSGKCYYNFNKEKHVSDVRYDNRFPLLLSQDFNVGIMSTEFCQNIKGHLNIFDEVTTKQTNVFKHVPAVQKKLIELADGNEQIARSRKVTWYGDASGFAANVVGRGTAWDEIEAFFRGWTYEIKVSASNPHIDARVAEVNGRLMSADKIIHTTIDPKCVELIKDLDELNVNDVLKKDNEGERTHSSDGVGYLIHKIWPYRFASIGNK
jgi:hypothetical protein